MLDLEEPAVGGREGFEDHDGTIPFGGSSPISVIDGQSGRGTLLSVDCAL